jgi:hypothetical protein
MAENPPWLRALRASLSAFKLLVGDVKLNYAFGDFEQKMRSAVSLLERAVQLDPNFALAYCASAEAHDLLYLYYNPTPEQVFDRLIGLAPDQPMLKVQKASVISFMETGDDAPLRGAIAALPAKAKGENVTGKGGSAQ